MTLKEYLKSKVFFKQVGIAFAIIAVIFFALLQWISVYSRHGEEITVPNLSGLSMDQAEEKLDDLDLDYELLDTTDFNPEFPKFSVVKQDPLPGAKVKEGRVVYIKLNSGTFTAVKMPDLIEKSLREAEPTLRSIGLEVGEVTTKPYIGKDMVIEMYYHGKMLKAGDKVYKNSKIDLVVGDGSQGEEDQNQEEQAPVEEQPVDSTNTNVE